MVAGSAAGIGIEETILVRYGELGIKTAPVRRRFESTLIANLEDRMVREQIPGAIRKEFGRIFVDADAKRAVRVLTRVFGVVSVSPTRVVHADLEAIAQASEAAARRVLGPGESFAVRARRTGTHTFTSIDVARACGARIQTELEGLSLRVDLEAPDHEIEIEVRQNDAYVFTETVPGPGGLPLGTQGRVVALIEDEASAFAAWLAMKRGCAVTLVVPRHHEPDVKQLLGALVDWGASPDTRFFPPPAEPNPALARAVALLVATDVARRDHASAIVTGDSLRWVEWLSSMDRWASVPVMRPVVGFTNVECQERCKELGFQQVPPLYEPSDVTWMEPETAQVRLLSSMALHDVGRFAGG